MHHGSFVNMIILYTVADACHFSMLKYLSNPVSVKIQLARLYVWFAMEDGVSVREITHYFKLRNYISPLITLIYGYGIMTMAVYILVHP